ncbi:MAG: OB-fold nucleic acid binding domain-containing protein, partial [Acidimicrobiales bacterium]
MAAAEALGSATRERQRLEQLGITTLRSVVEYWPRDHYDYSAPIRINRMYTDMQVTLVGTLRSVDVRRTANRNLQIIEAKISDPTGLMSVTWFNQPYLLKTLKPREGEQIAVSGKVELKNGRLQLAPRDVEFPADEEAGTNTMGVVPIYPSSEGIAQRWLRKLIRRALAAGAALITDPLPQEVRTRFGRPDRRAAVLQYHFPESLEERDRARNRLALDELLLIQLGMLQRKHEWQEEGEGRSIAADPELLGQFRAGLPFTLTAAQDTALAEILTDMGRPTPMSRLLQGDVGSGKTVVAAAALLLCARAGMQGTIMAPTEILAEQHGRT